MPAGRPPLGIMHVNKLVGSAGQKKRLRVILESLNGEITIESACEQLGIGETQFNNLRKRVLQASLDALAPGSPGRPRQTAPADPARLLELERQVSDLSIELEAAMVRTELALIMPELIKLPPEHERQKKTSRRTPPATAGG